MMLVYRLPWQVVPEREQIHQPPACGATDGSK